MSFLPPEHRDTLLVGTSPGIRQVHTPRALPFDTVTYLLRAEVARTLRSDATGVCFAVDSRLDGDRTDAAAIQCRTERLRALVHTILPAFHVRTHGDLLADGLEDTLERTPAPPTVTDSSLRHYARVQTAQVLHLRHRYAPTPDRRLTKFGWILARRSGHRPEGGEVHFDRLLPADAAVETEYTAPGFLLSACNGKAPYLLSEADRAERICLVDDAADIADEVTKIRPGISRLMVDTLRATAETVLGERGRIHDAADPMVTLPLAPQLHRPVTDARELSDLRECLTAALSRLLP